MALIDEFRSELEYFNEDCFVDFTEEVLEKFPHYFRIAPSTSSGKYHPEDERGEKGLILHTRRVMWACNEVSRALKLPERMHNCFVLAGLVHDAEKFTCDEIGNVNGTDPFHPIKPRERFKGLTEIIGTESYDLTMSLVESHSGFWSPTPRLIPAEDELLLWTFHLCDYLVSRKEVKVNI